MHAASCVRSVTTGLGR